MKGLLLAFPLALIAACSQNPDGSTTLGMKGSPAWFASAPPEAIAAHFAARCQAYGYQPGTAEMTRCIHDSADAGRVQAQQSAAYTSEVFGRIQTNAQATALAASQRRLNCQSHVSGSYMTTNCY